MINIICKDDFLLKQIQSLVNQKKFHQNYLFEKFLTSLEITTDNDQIKIIVNKKSSSISLPFTLDAFYTIVINLSSDIKINLQDFTFYPFQNLLRNTKQKQCFLSNIQNIIFSLLVTSSDGIDKTQVYKFIWPNNKEFSINKLDTHLTNLKKKLKSEIDFNFQIKSHDKNIKLIID